MLRFSIRDVLWLMVVVGLGMAWCMDHKSTTLTELRLATALHSEARLRQELATATSERQETVKMWEAIGAAFGALPEEHKEIVRESFSEEIKRRGITIIDVR